MLESTWLFDANVDAKLGIGDLIHMLKNHFNSCRAGLLSYKDPHIFFS